MAGASPEDQPRFLQQVYPTETYLDVAEALGARTVVAVHFGAPAPVDVAVIRFGELCDAAADRSLDVAMEFVAFATIADVASAWDIVRLADRPNGGLLVDTWHHRRSGAGDEALAGVDGTKVLSVQLADGSAEPVGPPIDDVMYRCLPGTGAFGITGLLRLLDDLGTRAPIGIEVFDQALIDAGARAAARQLGDSLRQAVGDALGTR